MVTHCNSIRALWYEMPAKLQTNEQCSSKKTRQYRTIKHTRVYQFSICPWWCAGHMTSAQRIQEIRELQFRKSPSQIVLAAGQRRFLPLWNSSFLGFLKSCQQKQQQTHFVAWEDLEQTAEMFSSPPNPLPELYHRARWRDLAEPVLPQKPFSTVINGVSWLVPKKGTGLLEFPSSFTGEIATHIATAETLGHFGAKFANE